MTFEIYSKKIDHLKWINKHNVDLLKDTRDLKIEKLAKKFEADKEALTEKFDQKIKEEYVLYNKESNHLSGKYLSIEK